MSKVKGYYYDGKSSTRRSVSIQRSGDELQISGDGVEITYPAIGIKVSAPIGNTRRSIRFPDNALCEIISESGIDGILDGHAENRFNRWIHHWERNLLLATCTLAVTIGVIFSFIKYGIPVIAKHVAFAVPPKTETSMGKEALAVLDKLMMKPSELPETRRKELVSLFDKLRNDMPGGKDYRIEFRSGKAIGANAFALPSGIIVVTDDLVKLSKHDEEIIGVLAHEAGHVQKRHILRHVLQNSGTGLLIAAITGDILSITSLSATLPTTLIDAKYSRDFEREADDAAVSYLIQHNIDPEFYADMLGRLQAEHDKKSGEKEEHRSKTGLFEMFESHPDTAERINRIKSLKRR